MWQGRHISTDQILKTKLVFAFTKKKKRKKERNNAPPSSVTLLTVLLPLLR